ncbi:hypothetical protein [Spirosoma sordidisoli]|uniref:Uncharacterized protein n=1 Tax=Spirosoma sordidisoli TaxID=2502893 RepID=A0A4Q2UK83_9BACT|nr:hypothetical protein [Spirosoma sordidisoli]RYC69606.1 hypothetical protein EQG79_13465 [Spirosoma sordidisoli]
MSEIKQLTPQQLGAFIDKTVQMDVPYSPVHDQVGALVCVSAIDAYVRTKVFNYHTFRHHQVRPVLRTPLEVTDEEWVVFFGNSITVDRDANCTQITLPYQDGKRTGKMSYLIFQNGEMSSMEYSDQLCELHAPLAWASLIDYLRSISVDCNGWIQQGLAVHAQPDKP